MTAPVVKSIELRPFARNCDKFIVELEEAIEIARFAEAGLPVDNYSERFGVVILNLGSANCSLFRTGKVVVKGADTAEEAQEIMMDLLSRGGMNHLRITLPA
ncbi:TBP family protein [Phaeacidiphilus oryzae]|uniref:hypothetical protein n=1 Tax=Phaeacidiphilus oryzae TaxID=348818 RepID=UPI00055F7C3E|nr:hypothetical protein [Phaeacidiphilus oryzae]